MTWTDRSEVCYMGNGSLNVKLERQAPASVEFLGHLLIIAMMEEYSRAPVTICPYENEGFGMVVIDWMSCGTSVIGLNSGNLSSIIKTKQKECVRNSIFTSR